MTHGPTGVRHQRGRCGERIEVKCAVVLEHQRQIAGGQLDEAELVAERAHLLEKRFGSIGMQ